MTEKELVEGCIKKKRVIQHAFFKKYYGILMGAAMVRCSCQDDAEDLVQRTFIKVFENLHKFDYKGSLEGWLKRILVNMFIDDCRKKKIMKEDLQIFSSGIQPNSSDNDRFIDGNKQFDKGGEAIKILTSDNFHEDPVEFDLQEDFIEKLEVGDFIEMIQNLSPKYRAVFTLHVLDKMKHEEIAEALGITISTSKSNYHKARKNLMKMLKEKENEKCI